jgi:hypothetical protein
MLLVQSFDPPLIKATITPEFDYGNYNSKGFRLDARLSKPVFFD